MYQPPSLVQALSALVYAGTSAAAFGVALHLLQPPPAPAAPQPTFIKTLVAFDFNTPSTSNGPTPTSSNGFASPFLLAALEQFGHAVAWLVIGGLSLSANTTASPQATYRRQRQQPTSHRRGPLTNNLAVLLAAPLLALASASFFTVWSSALAQVELAPTSSVPTAAPLFALRAVAFMAFYILSKPLSRATRKHPSLSAFVAVLLGVLGAEWLAAVSSVSNFLGASVLLLFAGGGPIIADCLVSEQPAPSSWMMAGQSLLSSLLSLNASFLTRQAPPSALSVESTLGFVALSAIAAFARVSSSPFPAAPAPSTEFLCWGLSLIATWLDGLRDDSSFLFKAGCLATFLLASAMQWPLHSLQAGPVDSAEYYGLPTSSPRSPRARHVKLNVDREVDGTDGDGEAGHLRRGAVSTASEPSFPTFIYRLGVLIVGVLGLAALLRPPSHHHHSPSLPLQLANPMSSTSSPPPMIVATFHVDRSLPAPTVSQRKSARPFAVNATIVDSDADGREQWSANIAPLSTWPRRKWDPSPNATDSLLTLSDLQFGVSGNAKAFDRIALASQTWANHAQVKWTVFWTEADDPNGMHGDHSYLLDGFKALTGRYPVVMRGDPAHPERTMNRKWFKTLSFLYERSPASTKWFVIGDDDTVWFPRVLLESLQSLPVDPLTDSLYLGDLSEARKAVDTFGKTMAFGGGGVVISRALAGRIHAQHRWCLDKLPDHHGDGLLRTCIEKVTAMDGQGKVTLTRMPIFNQIDLHPWLRDGRLYLSSRFARAAPASLHHPDSLPSLMAESPNKLLALYNLWHILARVPVELMFRRFFIHIESRGTAVVTFGLHVRIYMRRLATLEHAVDYDSNISRDKEFVGVEYLLEEKLDNPDDKSKWPKQRQDYQDFWISEFDSATNRMVFLDKKNKMSLVLTCQGPGSSFLTMCSEEE